MAAAAAVTCDSYCTKVVANCTGTNAQFANNGACLGTCSAWAAGTAGATTGNSLACRMYHLSVAATDTTQAGTHCPHTTTASAAGTCQ